MTDTEGDTLILITPRDLKLGSNDVQRLFWKTNSLKAMRQHFGRQLDCVWKLFANFPESFVGHHECCDDPSKMCEAVRLSVIRLSRLDAISCFLDQTKHVASAVACCRIWVPFGAIWFHLVPLGLLGAMHLRRNMLRLLWHVVAFDFHLVPFGLLGAMHLSAIWSRMHQPWGWQVQL